MGKQKRLKLLKEILKEGEFCSQEDICAALSVRHMDVPQASLSRDLRELSVEKKEGIYRLPSASGGLVPAVTSLIRAGENMVVLRTPAGAATLLALQVDRAEIPGVAGTVAGDDTVFVALCDPEAWRLLARMVEDRF